MKDFDALVEQGMRGEGVDFSTALRLYTHLPLAYLCAGAEKIRKARFANAFDLCTIINGKSGNCSEDCRFCAQSAHYTTESESYNLLDTDTIIADAKKQQEAGVLRYSIVTSGRKLQGKDFDAVCATVRRLKEEVDIDVCASLGLLDEDAFRQLKEAGVSRVHNNLETSEAFFASVCTTHTWQDKRDALQAAQRAGLSICSGGIFGLGESIEDRIDMALALRALRVKSVPMNFLNPIEGTPLAGQTPLDMDEARRIVAVYRFILPDAVLRIAGGRGLFADKGKSLFASGANAAITGDMLTTQGISVEQDYKMLDALGFEARCIHG